MDLPEKCEDALPLVEHVGAFYFDRLVIDCILMCYRGQRGKPNVNSGHHIIPANQNKRETCFSWSACWKSLIFMAGLLNSHD